MAKGSVGPTSASPRAYSYIRFSTPHQALGDSLRRQVEKTAAYCLGRGLILDETMKDPGLSGYHGRNMKDGALGSFVERIKMGGIPPGSVLIVEALDRLSRQKPRLAQQHFLEIINNGVKIFTLIDGIEYSAETLDKNFGTIFLSIGMMVGAHAESANKADRIKESWIKRREAGSVTNTVPSWIRKAPATDTAPARLVVDETKKSHVLLLAELALTMGADKIAVRMNNQKIPCLRGNLRTRSSGVWDQGVILKILRSRALLGEQAIGHYENQKRVLTGEYRKGAYPAIMTGPQWFAIQQALDSRRRGSGNALAGGRNATKITNMFGALARCGICGNRMIVVQKGRGSTHYIRCSFAKLGQCTATKFHRLDKVEPLFLSIFGEAVLSSVETPKDDPAEALQAELEDVRVEAARLATTYETMFIRSAGEAPDSLASKTLVKIAKEHKASLATIKKLESGIFAARAAKPSLEQFNLMRERIISLRLPVCSSAFTGSGRPIKPLTNDERIMTRAKIAASLPSLIKAMRFQPDGSHAVEMVDDLPATLPANRAGDLVRLWHQDGNRFVFRASGEISDRRVHSRHTGSGKYSRPASPAA